MNSRIDLKFNSFLLVLGQKIFLLPLLDVDDGYCDNLSPSLLSNGLSRTIRKKIKR